MNIFRAYSFPCLCGRQAEGRYQVKDFTEAAGPVDPKRAICHKMSGLPENRKGKISRNSAEPHEVGCGRTLAEANA